MTHFLSVPSRVGQRFILVLAVVLTAARCSPAQAEVVRKPVLVAAFKSVDTLLGNIDTFFAASGNERYAQVVRGFVANLNGLKGIDRGRPFGVMAFSPAEPGRDPLVAFFVPVANIDDLKSSVRLGNVISLENGSAEDEYLLRTPEKTIPIRLAHGYAFISEQPDALERPLPAP